MIGLVCISTNGHLGIAIGKTSDYDKNMNLCERIIRVYEKERFEQLKRNDSRSQSKSPFNKLIDKDVKDCERIILSVCEGRFPK